MLTHPRAGQLTSAEPPVVLGGPLSLALPVHSTVRLLVMAMTVIVLCSALATWMALALGDFPGRDLFGNLVRVGGEANIPTLFSGAILALAAALMGVIGHARAVAGAALARTWKAFAWVLVYLSVDEIAQIHDRTTIGMRQLVGDAGLLHYSWIALYGVVVLIVGVLSVAFLRHLPAKTRNGLMLAGFLYVLGAMGLEAVEGLLEASGQYRSLAMPVLVHIEETLEMGAVILVIATLLAYIRAQLPDLWVGAALD